MRLKWEPGARCVFFHANEWTPGTVIQAERDLAGKTYMVKIRFGHQEAGPTQWVAAHRARLVPLTDTR